jgi:cytochrome c oxidase subunit 2
VAVFSLLAQFAPVPPESPNADGIRDSYLFITIFTFSIFLLVEGLLVAFIWKYRRQKRTRYEDGAQVHGATRLELAWTAFPVVVLFLIGAFVFIELPGIKDVPDAAAGEQQLEIEVTGRQFYWQYEYPNGVVAIDHMRAPAGVPVLLEVTSPDTDVIHSWWIPALGGKIDAIPGRTNETWFQAQREGKFTGQCAELCGLEHAQMLATVEVLSASAFDDWLDEQQRAQSTASVELGMEEWDGVCAKCHGLEGQGGIGPPIAGAPTLTNEVALKALVENGRGEMPAVGSGWTNEQVASLAAYLKEDPPSGS